MRRMLLAIAFVVTLAACGGDGSATDESYGPLAVVEGGAGGPDAGFDGVLRIDDDCVTVVSGSYETLVIWQTELVSWDEANEQLVAVVRDQAEPVRFGDGDRIALGGSDLVGDESPLGITVATMLDDIDWVSAPAETCVDRIEHAWSTSGIAPG